MKEFRFFF